MYRVFALRMAPLRRLMPATKGTTMAGVRVIEAHDGGRLFELHTVVGGFDVHTFVVPAELEDALRLAREDAK